MSLRSTTGTVASGKTPSDAMATIQSSSRCKSGLFDFGAENFELRNALALIALHDHEIGRATAA